MKDSIKRSEQTLMKGNEALAEAAIRAGMDAYFGYPITPQSEILEYLIKHGPERDVVVLQAESEVASINMVYGAAGAGSRVMISSSSPGISLMQEGISYIASAQIPCLIVNVQRGGPGLGTIQPAQSDYFQATKGGGHGDYRLIVLAPASVQEMADFVVDGFELAEKYRNPAMILTDGALGQMMEGVELPEENQLPKEVPAWATRGKPEDKDRRIITSLFIQPEEMEAVNHVLQEKYHRMQSEARAEVIQTDDAEVIFVAFGLASRICQKVVEMAREQGVKAGLIRPITLYPYPSDVIREAADRVERFIVVEMNAGQMIEDVRLAVEGKKPVDFTGRMGGIIQTAEEIFEKMQELHQPVQS
jgi:2-oxoglutarate ferredoxin oxidoreductase subunit alpha